MAMATLSFFQTNGSISQDMEKTAHWFSSQIPSDVVVHIGEVTFPLHKFMLVAKSNRLRKLILNAIDVSRIDLPDIPGGAEAFDIAVKFCYGNDENLNITTHNVAAVLCAAEYLEMTDDYCDNNLAGRAENFLKQVALTSLSGSLTVLQSCQRLLPFADDLGLVQRCVGIACAKACVEANFPSRKPANWWTEELTILAITFLEKIIVAMKSRGATSLSLASAVVTYAERSFNDLVGKNSSGHGSKALPLQGSDVIRMRKREILEGIVALMPSDKSVFSMDFLCCLLKMAIFLRANNHCKNELEKRISAVLENMTVDGLLVISFTDDGETGLFDLESVSRIVSGFVEKEKSVTVFDADDFSEAFSSNMQRVAKTVDAYLGEIATYSNLSIPKFSRIANLVPKEARKGEDNLYRAIDIFLKAHPNLDELAREKVCSVMDPLKLSSEARIHASQNKRLPVQIVQHSLYRNNLRSRNVVGNDSGALDAMVTRNQVLADVSLAKENQALRTEILQMKMYIQGMQKPHSIRTSSKVAAMRKSTTLFLSVSRTLGRLNPFKKGSKDTSNVEDDGAGDVADIACKPKKMRRFSMS